MLNFRGWGFPGVLLSLLTTGSLALAAPSPSVRLGPEVNVGAVVGHPELSQYQADLRCDPTNARRMMISAKIESTPDESERETALFATRDNGATWNFTSLVGSGDPDVAFDERGVAHWSFIHMGSQRRGPIGYRRSTDGGVTWSETRDLPAELDHAHIVCAPGNRVFITGRAFAGGVQVLRSVDGGNSFDVVKAALPGALNEGFVYGTAVLADGTLVVPFMAANTMLADGRNYYAGNVRSIHCLRLKPGSTRFEEPVFIAPSINILGDGAGASTVLGGFAVGRWQNKERIYLSFSRPRNDKKPALPMLSTSDDGGLHWSPGRAIAPDVPQGAGSGSSSVMVNKNGVVGVSWYAMEEAGNFDICFCASTDGGQTFSPPVRVSSQSSHEPRVEARYPGQDQVYGSASPDGTFRLVWTDARNAAPGYQVFARAAMVSAPRFNKKATLRIENGFGAGLYEAESRVAISAAAPPAGQEFDHWSSSREPVEDATQPVAIITTGEGQTTVTAHFRPQRKFKLSVSGGSGSGLYAAGTLVDVRADAPLDGQKFAHWNGPNGIGFTAPSNPASQFFMPAYDVSVAPVYEAK